MPGTLDLPELVAALIHLVHKGNKVIRDVKRAGNLQVVEKFEGENPTAAQTDPQTLADRRVQLLIVGTLEKMFPDLTVVGEEEGVLHDDSDPEGLDDPVPVTHDEVDAASFPSAYRSIPYEDVVVFVDPLDATKQFTSGNISAVTVLAGVCMRGTPTAGVIGRPFHDPQSNLHDASLDHAGRVTWGCIDVGVFGLRKAQIPEEHKEGFAVCMTDSRPTEQLATAIKVLEPARVLRLGGAANKALHVIEGECHAYIMCGRGTKRWDTAAPEAIVRALGGFMTDTEGNAYDYVADPSKMHNTRGLLLSLRHEDLDMLRYACSYDSSTADITREPLGEPLTVSWLQEHTCIPHIEHVVGFTAPESSTVRTRHSHVVKLHLRYPLSMKHDELTGVVLVKRCVASDLDDRPLPKFVRDVQSYENEARFVLNLSNTLRSEANIHVPESYHSTIIPAPEPRDAKFMTIVESLETYTQSSPLTYGQSQAALSQLAKFHAFFMTHPESLAQAADLLWKQGGYWDYEKRKCMGGELETIEQTYLTMLSRFEDDDFFKQDDVMAVGAWYQKHAARLDEKLRENGRCTRTVIHGDYKPANIFFAKHASFSEMPSEQAAAADCSHDTAMIDWQWTGLGCPAMDVIYFMITALDGSTLEREGDLLRFYHAQLQFFLGADSDAHSSFESFQEEYAIASADYIRMLISYVLKSVSPSEIERLKNEKSRGMYVRDVGNLKWLISRAVELQQQLAATVE